MEQQERFDYADKEQLKIAKNLAGKVKRFGKSDKSIEVLTHEMYVMLERTKEHAND